MIKKLRVKIISAAMLSLFLVLLVTLGTIGAYVYHELAEEADSTLSILADNDGTFPDNMGMSGFGSPPGIMPSGRNAFSPELQYESRYFSVFFSEKGNVILVNTGNIAAVDTTLAIEYAEEVLSGGKLSGFMGDYRYVVYAVNTETHVIFLDCTKSLTTFDNYVLAGIGVSIVGLIIVFLLMLFLSERIVRPFSENLEKQKRFITDAGHELKTPLTIIDADAEILQMDYGENEWLDDIQNQTKRLAELTNSLIMLSRMEEGEPKTEMIEFPLSDIAEDTADTFKSVAVTQNKTLTHDIQPMVSMVGDEKSIGQLISILLDNAVKYSNPGGEISLKLEKQKNSINLSVFNTAEHVSKESTLHFFDRFYRADESRSSQTGGYGLGLSIASAIVSAHKGKILASTQDEKSLLITVTFPSQQ